LEEYTDAPYFIPLIWQGDGGNSSPHNAQRKSIYGVGGIPHAQWGGTYQIVGGGGSTMFSQYRTRYNAMVNWDSPLEIEMLLDPAYETVTAEITVTGEITSSNNKVIFILSNQQTSDYFCSVITYDEYDFDLDEIGESETFIHELNIGNYDIEDITVNVLVQTLSPDYLIMQAGRVIVAEETVPLHVDALEYEPVMVGETATQIMQIYNYSDDVLTGMMFPPTGFNAPAEFNVAAHSIEEVEIEFAPQQAGIYSDIMIVTTSNPDYTTFFIDVSGEGLPNSGAENNDIIPIAEISGNYPNPFNPETTLVYNLTEAASITLGIYNIRGEEVAVLQQGYMAAGEHRVIWQSENLPAGVYLARLVSGDYNTEHKLLLLK
jgi:Secretion system C-terminal sorting domain